MFRNCSTFKRKVSQTTGFFPLSWTSSSCRFGDGYTIFIRTTADSNRTRVIQYIQQSISQAIVKEEHNKMIHFRVPTSIPLYKIFTILENARKELADLIEDYTVTQVTLDDVFVSFAQMQKEDEIDVPM